MNGWTIVVDRRGDSKGAEQGRTIVTTRDYIAAPQKPNGRANGAAPKVINLSRSYAYLSTGYYCSLLAEARGPRVIPMVETILELKATSLYSNALPALEENLNRRIRNLSPPPEGPLKLLVCFHRVYDPPFAALGALVFARLRRPVPANR